MVSRYRFFVLLLSTLFGLALILLIPGYAVSRNLGGSEAVEGMIWACGLCLVAAALGGLPLLVVGRSAQETGSLALGSLAIRMGITLFGALAITLGTEVQRTPFLLWLVVWYTVFLIADVCFLIARNRAEEPRT